MWEPPSWFHVEQTLFVKVNLLRACVSRSAGEPSSMVSGFDCIAVFLCRSFAVWVEQPCVWDAVWTRLASGTSSFSCLSLTAFLFLEAVLSLCELGALQLPWADVSRSVGVGSTVRTFLRSITPVYTLFFNT